MAKLNPCHLSPPPSLKIKTLNIDKKRLPPLFVSICLFPGFCRKQVLDSILYLSKGWQTHASSLWGTFYLGLKYPPKGDFSLVESEGLGCTSQVLVRWGGDLCGSTLPAAELFPMRQPSMRDLLCQPNTILCRSISKMLVHNFWLPLLTLQQWLEGLMFRSHLKYPWGRLSSHCRQSAFATRLRRGKTKPHSSTDVAAFMCL